MTVDTLGRAFDLYRRTATSRSSIALLIANAIPLIGVLFFGWSLITILVLYWIENVIVYAFTIVKLLTVEPTNGGLAGFFALHYGIFTFVHGVFAFILAGLTGWFIGGWLYWIVVVAAMLASHVLSLGLNWFGRGEYRVASAGRVMALPYPRMLVMHGAVIAGAFLVFDARPAHSQEVTAVAILCGAKAVIDLVFHLVERFANSRVLAASTD